MLLAGSIVAAGVTTAAPIAAAALATPDHVVLVILENRSFAKLIEADQARFIHRLAATGALFTNSFSVSHPSQPNYFALFTGSTQGIDDDDSYMFAAPTLASSLRAKGYSFIGYVERGSPRKHNPWQSFIDSQSVQRDISQFPSDFTKLPTVSFIVPNLDNDMHDGGIGRGDAWVRRHLGAYVQWCSQTNNLLIVTFDESDSGASNQILTIFFGGPVRPGRYGEWIDHYSVLRTIEAMYDLPPLGRTAERKPIEDVWNDASIGVKAD